MGGMGDDDEFDFEGDAFDALPANTLHQLERDALKSTQHPRHTQTSKQFIKAPAVKRSPPSDYEFEDDDIIDLNAEPISIPRAQNRPANVSSVAQQAHQAQPRPQSVYRENNPPYRPPKPILNGAAPPSQGNWRTTQAPSKPPAFASQPWEVVPSQEQEQEQNGAQDARVEALMAQLQALQSENEDLKKANDESQTAFQTKAGEAANMRRKVQTTSNEFEKRIRQIQEAHSDALGKQKEQLELAIRQKKQVEENQRFLQNDLRLEQATTGAKQSRGALRGGIGDRAGSIGAGATTPKKTQQHLPFRDGFDDGDIIMVSPSKTRDKQKLLTPKKGEKRKRSTEQSPGQLLALPLSEPVGSPAIASPANGLHREQTSSISRRSHKTAVERYNLMAKLINYHPSEDSNDQFFDALSTHSFPSDPSRRLSSIITTKLQTVAKTASFPLEMMKIILAVWQQCLDEKYHGPLHVLVGTAKFLLSLQSLAFASQLVASILPLLMSTIDLIAIDVGKAGANGTFTLPAEVAALEPTIPSESCIELLSFAAIACEATRFNPVLKGGSTPDGDVPDALDPGPPLSMFWKTMQFDFALVLLVRSQPLSTMRTMLQVLQTSCLPSTFGPIIPAADGDMNVERQASREVGLIDRLLNLLIEVPKPMKGCDGYDDCHIAALRLDVLGVFMAMCTKGFSPDTKESHGGKLLAEHKLTIGRLFRFLCDSVNLLYVYPPVEITDIPLPTSSPDDQDAAATEETQESPHSLTCRAINATVRILHHVLTTYTSLIDLPKKLAAIHGGPHKHLIGLARLAFSDQVFMEAGIESDVVDAAHEMLDGYLTFEEGESLLSLFSTPPNKSVPPERDDGDKEMEQGENKRET